MIIVDTYEGEKVIFWEVEIGEVFEGDRNALTSHNDEGEYDPMEIFAIKVDEDFAFDICNNEVFHIVKMDTEVTPRNAKIILS